MDALHAVESSPLARVSSATISRVADAAILPVAIGLLSYATVAQGGFYRAQGSFFAAGLLALALASVSSAASLTPLIAGAALLGLGVAASGLASGWGPNTPQIVAALCAGVAIVPATRRVIARGERARLLEAVAWIGAGSALVGMIGVAFHRSPWAMPAASLWRTSATLTYANAAGCLFVLALGASILALAERPSAARRLAAFLTLTGLASSLSRGAVVGCAVGMIVLAAFGRVGLLKGLARPALGALCAFACLVPSIAGQPRPALAIAGLVAGAAIAARPGRLVRAIKRPYAVALAAILVVVLGALVASAGASRVFERRALPASETRLRTWKNTLDMALEKPMLGYGPGTFSIVEEDPKAGPVLTRYVHNEYLQVLFETGAVGLATVVGAITIFGAWAWRRRDNGGHWALAVAICAAFAAHSAFDFLWRLPVLVALAFMWLAIAVTPPAENGGTK